MDPDAVNDVGKSMPRSIVPRSWLFGCLALCACHGERPASAPTTEARPVAAVEPRSAILPTESREEDPPPAPAKPKIHASDTGIWSDLDEQVSIAFPSWLTPHAGEVVRTPAGDSFVYVSGHAVGLAQNPASSIDVTELSGGDRDADGIPDALDILLGAKKTVLNRAAYGSPYRELDYPGGDVPRNEGVCTDVVVRAVRNAGIDLQKELHEDIGRRPKAFPMVETANANIDHRRVKTLLPYFLEHWDSLPTSPDDPTSAWHPGDVIFMQTMGDKRPDHMGIVSDRLGESGAPLIINNWTDGYSTAEMDVAKFVPITHRFRLRPSLRVPAEHAGLEGLLARTGVTLDAKHRQALVVTFSSWDRPHATIRRYARSNGRWTAVGDAIAATLGSGGLGVGRGLYAGEGDDARASSRRPKVEGDRRSPAGVFALGTAFGPGRKPYRGPWPWRATDEHDRWVDDPRSDHYNTWQRSDGPVTWSSAERLADYQLGLVVEHNTSPVKADGGSAIFLHTWQGDPRPTLGCTAMSERDLKRILQWVDPEHAPILVQLPGVVFEAEQ